MNRIIIHSDMNCYFASVEQQANPLLRGKPIGITGKSNKRSVVATASIEAKRLGVKTAMSTWEAKRVCPSLILIPGDPQKYSFVTNLFNKIYSEFSSNIEHFSVDESFLDVTDEARDYFGAAFIAQAIRARLKEECGERITASIGAGPNKLIAKLSSESVKPNGLTITKPSEVIKLIDSSKLQDVCGIGPRIENRLNSLGITNFKHLREFPLERLVNEFKSYGYWLNDAASGIDHSPIISIKAEPKSVGHSYTLPNDAWDVNTIKRFLLGLSDKVAWRLRRDGLKAKRVTAYVRYGDFSGSGQQKVFAESTDDGLTLFKIAWSIINSWRNETKPIRLLGISASKLSKGGSQQSIFKKDRNMNSALSALDKLQHRYGSSSWTRASLLKTKFKERSSGFHYDHEI
jgi:DNA polymerase IV